MVLWFPYDHHFNDITCNKAIATQFGSGKVRLVDDPKHGKVASFSGKAYLEVCTYIGIWYKYAQVIVLDCQ